MPASPQRRTRRVVPAAVEPEEAAEPRAYEPEPDPAPEQEEPRARAPRKAQQRRLQAAAADPKARLPREKQAVETADGIYAPVKGRKFRLSETIGLMPLMEWAAAQDDVDVTNTAALVGMFRILKDLVHADDWDAFRKFTRDEKCTDQDFLNFQNAAMEAIAARPTGAPAAS